MLKYLDILNVKYKINPRLARGLDYYCHTAFEFTTDKLGAQSTVLGGGRYDYLCKLMGGPDVPAVGFAGGIERLVLMMNDHNSKTPPIYVIPIGGECVDYTIKLTDQLRMNAIPVALELNGKVQKRMERALKDDADYIVFAGFEEMQNNVFKLKILATKEEIALSEKELLSFLNSKFKK